MSITREAIARKLEAAGLNADAAAVEAVIALGRAGLGDRGEVEIIAMRKAVAAAKLLPAAGGIR